MAANITSYAEQIVKNTALLGKYQDKLEFGRRPFTSIEHADYDKVSAIALTPENKSLFILLPLYYPSIYMDSENPADRRACKGILNYIAQTTKSLEGIMDKTLVVEEGAARTTFFNAPLAMRVDGSTKEITLTVPWEVSGYGVTDFFNHWINQITDENTMWAPYNGSKDDWNNWSHSCGWLYIKPTKNLTRVNFGAMFFQAIPTQVPYSNYNADAQGSGIMELSLQFRVNMVDTRNLVVREFCESVLAKYHATIVMDGSMQGLDKGTFLGMVQEETLGTPLDIVNNTVIGTPFVTA